MMLRLDLHIHSEFSADSKSQVEEIIRSAIEIGLNGIAITDHNRIEGYYIGKEYLDKSEHEFLLIPGIEISTLKGHLIALGVHESIQPNMSVEELLQQIKDMGGISILPHPFHPFRHSIGSVSYSVSAVEVFNARCISEISNQRAVRAAARHGLPSVAGSDAHDIGDIGHGVTEIEAQPSVSSILEGISLGRTRIDGRRVPRGKYISNRMQGIKKRYL